LLMTSQNKEGNDLWKSAEVKHCDVSRPKVDGFYSNMNDDVYVSSPERPPSVPPRILNDTNSLSKIHGTKKSIIDYPAMSKIPNPHLPTGTPLESQSTKDTCSPSVYSDMNLLSSTNGAFRSEDMYCDISENAGSSLPSLNRPTKTSHITKKLNETKKQSPAPKSNLGSGISTDPISGNLHLAMDDDEYCCPIVRTNNNNPMVQFDEVYNVPNEPSLVNSNGNTNLNDDDTYCDSHDDVEMVNCDTRDNMLSGWSDFDATRALRVAKNDRKLAREILLEFVGIR